MNALDAVSKTAEETGAVPPPPAPYSTRGWCELARMNLPPQVFFWGQAFALGSLGVIFGQGGLGKSRMALNLARNQVLGLPFADLSTGTVPLRHLQMGSENSIHRLQHDVRRMSGGLSQDQLELLGTSIRLATLENPEDPFITVASAENVARWRLTLEQHRPNVLWVDPWGDVLDGEANNDEDTRGTLRVLNRLLREVDPNAALIVLAHSRTGAKNIAQAVGFDSANFGKGSKALYSTARCVWNLAPADESESPGVVAFHAKNNNGPREKGFALILDPESMTYEKDPDFDFDEWLELVNQRANGKGKGKRTAQEPLESFRPIVQNALAAGPLAFWPTSFSPCSQPALRFVLPPVSMRSTICFSASLSFTGVGSSRICTASSNCTRLRKSSGPRCVISVLIASLVFSIFSPAMEPLRSITTPRFSGLRLRAMPAGAFNRISSLSSRSFAC